MEKREIALHIAQCGNYGNLLSHFFDKNFVKLTFLLKKIPQCGKVLKKAITLKNFHENHDRVRFMLLFHTTLVFSLLKTLLSRNFCQRSVTVNFRNLQNMCSNDFYDFFVKLIFATPLECIVHSALWNLRKFTVTLL